MPKTIVERLYDRSWAADERDPQADLMHAAADKIQRMEAAGNALVQLALLNPDTVTQRDWESAMSAWDASCRG